VPAFENWNFKLVLAAHSSWSFIFPQFWRKEALTIVNDELYIDGWNIARGWPLERELKTVWDNRLELRMPISEQLLWGILFIDGVYGAPDIADIGSMRLDDFYFSLGGGVRFTIPQFPIRLYLAKRFQFENGHLVPLEGDLPFFFNSTVEFVISLGGDTFF
jgi:outer membrane protein insertion porin family